MEALLVGGLGFGDEGKGSIVDFLTRAKHARVVIRFNGGAQAAHNVVTSEGQHHTFSQWGSGTFAGADTYLSRFMLVNPITMEAEEKRLQKVGVKNAFDLMHIDEKALLTNPFQIASNRFKELLRGKDRHGTCGMGISETIADALLAPEEALRAEDLRDRETLTSKLRASQQLKQTQMRALWDASPLTDMDEDMEVEWNLLWEPDVLDYCVARFDAFKSITSIVGASYLRSLKSVAGTMIFEGAQGALLDQAWGTFPHVTRSDTTFNNALRLLEGHPAVRVGVLRTYFTRHGAGPLPTEDPNLKFPDHNSWGSWQQNFRWGHFDLNLARYALKVVGGVDWLAFTCLDHTDTPQVCTRYEDFPVDWTTAPNVAPLESPQSEEHLQHQALLTESLRKVHPVYSEMTVPDLAKALGVPLGIVSRGPTAQDKIW